MSKPIDKIKTKLTNMYYKELDWKLNNHKIEVNNR